MTQRVLPFIAAAAVVAIALWWIFSSDELPEGLAMGNGRVEAEQIHVAAIYAGRVSEVLVREGDTVAEGQILARLDASALEAGMARMRAEAAQARSGVFEARAGIARRKAELTLAEREHRRAETLLRQGHTSEEQLDLRQSELEQAQAALEAAKAQYEAAERSVEAAGAEIKRLQVQIDDYVLKAPRDGRVQYRLAEPGEVLASGGRAVTLLDLSDVHMTIFLPSRDAGRLAVGSEARLVLDAAPEFVFPAKVSFVAADAQFTPRSVETKTERDKLMFRVEVKIDPALLRAHEERVKAGLPGVAYVRTGPDAVWPEALAPNPPAFPQRSVVR